MDLKKRVGIEIAKRRKDLKMEQVDLQDYAEVGSTVISKLEQGKANVTLETLEKILEPLGLEMLIQIKNR